jgi:hypothetical protein
MLNWFLSGKQNIAIYGIRKSSVVDDFPIRTSIYWRFPIATFDCWRISYIAKYRQQKARVPKFHQKLVSHTSPKYDNNFKHGIPCSKDGNEQ